MSHNMKAAAAAVLIVFLSVLTVAAPSSADPPSQRRSAHHHGPQDVDLSGRDDFTDGAYIWANVTTGNDSTVASLRIVGLARSHDGTTLAAHLHDTPCDVRNGGDHYESTVGAPGHQGHMHFTAEIRGGQVWVVVGADWEIRPGARSIVVHDHLTADNERAACVDLSTL